MSEAGKKHIDWELVEKDYRAGIKTLRQIADERGVSHVAIQKRAKTYGWTRDLSEKIQAKAKEKVTKAAVTRQSYQDGLETKEAKLTDAQVVDQYSDIVAKVDEIQREDVKTALSLSRSNLEEVALTVDPEYKTKINRLADLLEAAVRVKEENGKKNPQPDQADLDLLLANYHNLADVFALLKYTTSVHGRVKLAKEIAATHGVYIPLQRKIFGLDQEKQSTSDVDLLLKRINEEIQE